MVRPGLVLLAGWAILGVAGSVEEETSSVQFTEALPRAGLVLQEETRISAEVTVTVASDGQTVAESRQERTQTRSRRIVHSGGDGAAEARVRYGDCRVIQKGDAGTHDFEEAVSGKVYHLKREPERLRVTDEEGKIPPEIELLFVREDLARFDGRHPLGDLLGGKKIEFGDSLEIPETLVGEMLRGVDRKGEARLRKGTLTCRGPEPAGDRAGFDVSVELKAGGEKEGETSVTLTGRLVVLLEGARPVLLELSGPMSHRSEDREQKLEIEAQGNVSIRLSVAVSRAEEGEEGR